jgi:hypothetical protein
MMIVVVVVVTAIISAADQYITVYGFTFCIRIIHPALHHHIPVSGRLQLHRID